MLLSTQKGQSGQIFTCQNPSFEWRSTNYKPFEVKSIHSFVGFKAGRSHLKQPSPTSPASKPVDGD